jgi:hypothetical protein
VIRFIKLRGLVSVSEAVPTYRLLVCSTFPPCGVSLLEVVVPNLPTCDPFY